MAKKSKTQRKRLRKISINKEKKVHKELEAEQETRSNVPRSFVIRMGSVGPFVKQLVQDYRRVMLPYTAASLKETKSNTIKDFVSVAGPLAITHLFAFSSTDAATYLRIGRMVRGPTLTLRVLQFSLIEDLTRSQTNPESSSSNLYTSAPLVVLSNFKSPDPEQQKTLDLMGITFQNMFPTIKVNEVALRRCRRVVLFAYDPETQRVEFRHYGVKVSSIGFSKSIKKLSIDVPALGHLKDISEYVLNGVGTTESDVEAEEDVVQLPKSMRGTGRAQRKITSKTAVKLVEIGPRMTLQLVKVEQGLFKGAVIYHRYIKKTPEEIAQLEKRMKEKEKLRAERKKIQAANVEKKMAEKEEKDKKKKEKKEKRQQRKDAGEQISDSSESEEEEEQEEDLDLGDDDDDDFENDLEYDGEEENDEVDDREWYRKEVGEEPPSDLITQEKNNKKHEHKHKHKREGNNNNNSSSSNNNNKKNNGEEKGEDNSNKEKEKKEVRFARKGGRSNEGEEKADKFKSKKGKGFGFGFGNKKDGKEGATKKRGREERKDKPSGGNNSHNSKSKRFKK